MYLTLNNRDSSDIARLFTGEFLITLILRYLNIPLHVSIYLSLAAFHLHAFPDVGMSYFDIALRNLV